MYSLRVGGMSPAVTENSEAMARLGHDVHIFTRIGDNQLDYEKINGVHCHRCSFFPSENILEFCENMGNSMVDRFQIATRDFGEFQVLHGHDWHVINALDKIKQKTGKPYFLTFHSTEWGRNGNEFGEWYEFREIMGREWYGAFQAKRVITVSYTMKNELMWLYNVPDWKISVIPNGIRPENYYKTVDSGAVKQRYGIHPLAPTIFFIGRLVTQKGPDLLVEAIPKVINNRWDAKFIIAGGGGMRGHLEYLARKNGVMDSVRFLGYVPDEEYLDILNACDIVCIPSRNEPFGLVLLEAWSAEKAVVAADVGGLGENIDNFNNGIKVFNNPESIAWGINYIINDPGGVHHLGQEGKKAVKTRFSWDKIAADTVKYVYLL